MNGHPFYVRDVIPKRESFYVRYSLLYVWKVSCVSIGALLSYQMNRMVIYDGISFRVELAVYLTQG